MRRKIAGITRMSAKPGRETVLTDEEVGRLVQYVVEMCDMGFGLRFQANCIHNCHSIWKRTSICKWISWAELV